MFDSNCLVVICKTATGDSLDIVYGSNASIYVVYLELPGSQSFCSCPAFLNSVLARNTYPLVRPLQIQRKSY